MLSRFTKTFLVLCFTSLIGGMLCLAPGCASTDVKQAAKACSDVAVAAAAADIAPSVAEAIGCMAASSPDAGTEATQAAKCVEKSLGDLAKTIAPPVYACALAKIHDQTIP